MSSISCTIFFLHCCPFILFYFNSSFLPFILFCVFPCSFIFYPFSHFIYFHPSLFSLSFSPFPFLPSLFSLFPPFFLCKVFPFLCHSFLSNFIILFCPSGVIYLQYGDEIRRAMIPTNMNKIDQVHNLFENTFTEKFKREPNNNRKTIYIKDSSCGIFYELEDVT